MKLSKRLQAVYDLVDAPCVLADIGCDHALLPIALVTQGKCTKAYACDVHEGPLRRGQEAIQHAGLSQQITTVLTNGLQDVPEDSTCIIIAGMGWETIVSILSNDLTKALNCKQLILQSNNHVEKLRRWLNTNGFAIDREDLVHEQHDYQILSLHPGQQQLSEDELLFGVMLPSHPYFQEYWKHILYKKEKIFKGMQPQHTGYEELRVLIERIQKQVSE